MLYQTELTAYIDILRRRKHIIVVSILAALIIGATIAWTLPPVYRAQATIYAVSAQIPEKMLISFVNAWLESSVKFVEAMIFSRDRCLQIINEVGLYPDLMKKLPADDVVAYMKKQYSSENIYVTQGQGTGEYRRSDDWL